MIKRPHPLGPFTSHISRVCAFRPSSCAHPFVQLTSRRGASTRSRSSAIGHQRRLTAPKQGESLKTRSSRFLHCLPTPPVSAAVQQSPTNTTTLHRARILQTFTQPQPSTTMATSSPAGPLREQGLSPVERLTDSLETPSLDDRSYRVIKLPNQLEVLLVHDAKTDKASAAMDVNVGNYSDDPEMSGMAHAVEHLLFMGTKKYPVENAYSQYLAAHSGSSNAYTQTTSTNYYFEIAANRGDEDEVSPLYGALDRFAQFFIEPLFLESSLDRELRAVDSENKKNLQSDAWRLNQLDKSLSNPKHPYCHFSTGNYETLKTIPEAHGIDVRAKFIEFHATHYSANRMKLVILGKESLDTLEAWAAKLFAGVQNKNLPKKRWETDVPFTPEHLQTQIFAKPVMDHRRLELQFPFLDEEFLFESQPSRYISHLLGHEGPGSIMAYIKLKGWADGLSAGGYSICPGTPGLFSCSITLTEDGLKNYKEVVKVFFEYVSMLKETPPQEWIFQEQKGLADVDFKFKQKTPASRFTSKIGSIMQGPLPREWLLSGHSRLRKYDPIGIQQGLDYLCPENLRITLVSQQYPGVWKEKEKWYGTEYTLEKIPADFLADIHKAAASTTKTRSPELHLPHENQFIPTKLEVEKKEVKEPASEPKLIRNDEIARVWFKKDDTFWVPKANVFVNLRNNLPSATAENSLKARLFGDIVRDALEEYAYDADLAGLGYSVTTHSEGLEIYISGYNDKLPVLLEKVLVTMRDLKVKPERFEVVKDRMLRGLKNWDLQPAYTQIPDFARYLNSSQGFINDEILAELPHITAVDIQNFFPQLLGQMHIETFVHGNMYKEDALRLGDLVASTFKPRPLPKNLWPISRSLVFPEGGNYVYRRILTDPANVNNATYYSLSVGDKSIRPLRAKTLLLEQLTHEPAFDQLRTKEQLGYVVWAHATATLTGIGYRVIIQGENTPDYLDGRIEEFLTNFANTLAAMPDVEFEGHKRALINKRLEKLKNLDQESGRLWGHIDSEYLDFDITKHDAAQLRTITKADMTTFYNYYILPSSPTRSLLAVHLHAKKSASGTESKGLTAAVEKGMKVLGLNKKSDGKPEEEHKAANGTTPYVIDDVREFKSRMQVSAGPQPVKDISAFEELDAKL